MIVNNNSIQVKPTEFSEDIKTIYLRHFSKLICFATLFLIFVGGLVKSTESGLAVPDWPLSYGMLFPPMVGGVFYEHGHRLVAATIGLLMVILSLFLRFFEQRRWVRNLGFLALGTILLQGILGGITVLFFLPTPISVIHGILAQTFFILTILIAYSLSIEFRYRKNLYHELIYPPFIKIVALLVFTIYLQLIIGAIMRHTDSGLAIPDFPAMGGMLFPLFNHTMLDHINGMRFEMNLDPVTLNQVTIHFIHRLLAILILLTAIVLYHLSLKFYRENKRIRLTVYSLNILIVFQITLGVLTVLTQKEPYITSFHVMLGASTLGMSFLLLLRAIPLSLVEFKYCFLKAAYY